MSNFLERKKKKDSQANWIFILLFMVLIAGGAYLTYINLTEVKLSENDGCPIEGGARGTTAILFDNTDKNAAIDEVDIRANLYKIKDSVKKYQKLVVYIITEDANNISPELSICNPGSMTDENKFAFLYKTPRIIQQRWEENFSNDVDKIIQKLLRGGTSNWSPIFEMIQAVNISSFKHSNESYKNSNRLFIFSDFMHNTQEFSQYSDSSNFSKFKENYRSYYDRVYSMLRGTYVKMFVINRTPKESRDSMNFWKDFFVATNAKNPVPDIEYIGK